MPTAPQRRRRTTAPARVLVVAACILATAIAAGAAGRTAMVSSTGGQQEVTAATGRTDRDDADTRGAALTQRVCKDQCHTEDRITETRRAAFEWARLVIDMEARGARASEEEFDVIRRYLTRRYGSVNVNRAPASELVAVLGLSSKVAASVVAHRKQHGSFADLAALAAVPGVDRTALEADAAALRFN
ncbi:MAG: helix-hairpin-helix domain-containing protein [Acidobacteria bacterium]|nr:helix-hairpin-helix domain-containing protein [Acidobacteriota bacterium]